MPSSPSSSTKGNKNVLPNKRDNQFMLGSDAASSYYFSSVPKTPAVTSVQKKNQREGRKSSFMKRQSHKKQKTEVDHKNTNNSIIGSKEHVGDEENVNPNTINQKDQSMNASFSLSELKLKSPHFEQVDADESTVNDDTMDLMVLANFSALKADKSVSSIDSSSKRRLSTNSINSIVSGSGHNTSATNTSGEEEDTLNKSVLSDTTELTASNFVFAAQARQKLMKEFQSLKKMQKKINIDDWDDANDKNQNDKGDENDLTRNESLNNNNEENTMDFLQEFFHVESEATEEVAVNQEDKDNDNVGEKNNDPVQKSNLLGSKEENNGDKPSDNLLHSDDVAIASTVEEENVTSSQNTNVNQSTLSFLSSASPSPSLLHLRNKAANARRLTASFQKLKQRRESQKMEMRKRMSTGSMATNRLSLSGANVPLPKVHFEEKVSQLISKNVSELDSKIEATQGSHDDINVAKASVGNANVENTYHGGHNELKNILGQLVDNKDADSDESSDVSSIDGNLNLSLVKSPSIVLKDTTTIIPQEVVTEKAVDDKPVHHDAEVESEEENTNENIVDKDNTASSSLSSLVATLNESRSTTSPATKSTMKLGSSPAARMTKSPISKFGSSPASRIYVGVSSPAQNTRSSSKKRKSPFKPIDSSTPSSDRSSRSAAKKINLNLHETISDKSIISSVASPDIDNTADLVGYINVGWESLAAQKLDQIKAAEENKKSSLIHKSDNDSMKAQEDEDLKSCASNESSSPKKMSSLPKDETSSPLQEKEGSDDLKNSSTISVKSMQNDDTMSLPSVGSRASKLRLRSNIEDNNSENKSENNPPSSLLLKIDDNVPKGDVNDSKFNDALSDSEQDSDNSSDNSSCGSDTADTQDLQDIMENLKNTKSKTNSSSISSTHEVGMTSEYSNNTVDTASVDTQDLMGLLDGLESKDSSHDHGTTVSILETVKESQNIDIENNNNADQENEHDSSSTSEKSPNISQRLERSSEKKAHPKSILNSSRKTKGANTPKKSVLFYPPSAAEYNIGSPPMSITPMCKTKTRSLYQIPQLNNEKSALSPSTSDPNTSTKSCEDKENSNSMNEESDTIEFLKGLDSKVRTSVSENDITVTDGDTKTINLESDLASMLDGVPNNESKLIANVKDVNDSDMLESIDQTDSFSLRNSIIDKAPSDGDSTAMSLESNMIGMINGVGAEVNDTAMSEGETKTMNLEADMKDLLNGAAGEASESIDNVSEANDTAMSEGETKTMNLEADMKDLLSGVTSGASESVDNVSEVNDTAMSEGETKTMNLEADMKDLLNGVASEASESVDNVSEVNDTAMSEGETMTMNLEADMKDLLNGVSSNDTLSSIRKTFVIPESDTITFDFSSQEAAPYISFHNKGDLDQTDTISLRDNAIQQASYDGDTITMNLESDMKGLLNVVAENKSITHDTSQYNGPNESKSLKYSMTEDGTTLETKLHGLINNVDKSNDNIVLSESNNAESRNRRRSSRRVSLVPENISYHENDDSQIEDHISNNETNQKSNEFENKVDITLDEIYQKMPNIFSAMKNEQSSDILLDEARFAMMECSHSSVHQQINSFLMNVCAKMERDADQDDENITIPLGDVISNNFNDVKHMQNILRDEYSSFSEKVETKKVLQDLGDSISHCIGEELREWEIQVIDALSTRIGSLDSDILEDESGLERYSVLADDLQKSLLLLSQEAARAARQKSIKKKKEKALLLEAEIQRMEENIAKVEIELNSFQNESCTLKDCHRRLVKQNDTQTQITDAVNSAEKSFDKLKSIEGIVSWRVTELEESIISLEVKDRNIPQIHILMRFKDDSNGRSGRIVCEAKLIKDTETKVNGKHIYSKHNYGLNAVAYVEYCMEQICKDVNRFALYSSADMIHAVNHVEWNLGRLSLIGKELNTLQRRYKGSLKKCDDTSFMLELNIETKLGHRVDALFNICESYPFAVLNVDLSVDEGSDFNIGSLERQLTKTSRPGFGYLSRSCDIISCFEG